MLTIRMPSAEAIGRFLASQQGLAVPYSEGMTRGAVPAGFNVDHLRYKLGNGMQVFEQAVDALRTMFRQKGIRLESRGLPPNVGTVVAIVVRVGPVWWSNACRVVYVIDETRPLRRVGFANGTLPGHAECGEEVFLVEMDAAGDVWYDLRAYSRPRHPLARLGSPFTRAMQRRFAAGSAAAMAASVESAGSLGAQRVASL
jgi:uncharacterized protein (UPF0548 family)